MKEIGKKNILIKDLKFGENFFSFGEKTARICRHAYIIDIETYNTVSKSKYDADAELQAVSLHYTDYAEISPELIANIAIISKAQDLVHSTSEFLTI